MRLQAVVVSPSPALPDYIAAVDQLGDDPVSGALGDPHRRGDLPQPYAGVIGDAEQCQRVV